MIIFNRENTRLYGLFSALFLATATLTKSLLFPFPLYLILIALIVKILDTKKMVFIALLFYLFITPWAIRNTVVLGKFSPVSTEGGVSLYWENHKGAQAGKGYKKPEDFNPEKFKKMSEVERSNYYTKLALNFILHNPGKFIKISLGRAYGFLKFLPNTGLVAQFSLSEFLMRISYLLSYLPLFLIFLLLIFIKRKPKEYYLFCFIFLYFLAVYSVIAGKMRYRLPVEPFLIISSAIFLRFAIKSTFKKDIY